jgi:predicted kinase
MDLEFRGRVDLAHTLVQRYLSRVKDTSFKTVLPFYQCHRSLVRGKVRGFAFLQHPDEPQGKQARRLARRHFQWAVQYARRFSRPRLMAVSGLIGTGKSTLARQLAEAFEATWLRTDEIRRTEFERYRAASQEHMDSGLYAPEVSRQVYQRLCQRAEQALKRGHSVVCDGLFAKQSGRKALQAIAKRSGASFHLFECVVPKAVALQRIARRQAEGKDLSEARPEHYDYLKKGFEPVRGFTKSTYTRLSDNRPAEATFQAALRVLRRYWA